ncbi:sirohydrochlorin chelatase [Actinomarinicola tropica]|uniref:sirohydrochlorin chelatase n=1 Tax=Actinomarinicola tropica TaxID=2789776 RepID=UPI001898F895|nr:CbiX/SirB N-terminal domain-containing protein [Actinomarinicola tropica]
MSGTTWLVVAHGSRAPGVTADHDAVCAALGTRAPAGIDVRPAYLEINEPSIPDAIDAAVADGAERVVLVPYFLHAGNHTRRDIPAFVDEATVRHPGVALSMAEHLGPDDRLVAILADRAAEAGGERGR